MPILERVIHDIHGLWVPDIALRYCGRDIQTPRLQMQAPWVSPSCVAKAGA